MPDPGYELIRTKRRTVAIEIAPGPRILVRAPERMPRREIDALLAANAGWIEKQLEKTRDRAANFKNVPAAPEHRAELSARARDYLPGRTAHFSALTGLWPSGVKITSAKKRFGSCSGKNSLCFSCYLMLSPPEAIDYVILHELAHIRHKNHGREFYALIGGFMPDWKERKGRLVRAVFED